MDSPPSLSIVAAVPDFFTLDDLAAWTAPLSTLSPPARLAVIGDPIGHSKSPQMHNPALRACGIDAQYVRVRIPAGSVAQAFRLFAGRGFTGVNVTIPHKFEALEAVDVLDPQARRLGAVNTVAVRDGRLHGFNSDGPGFLRSVKEAFGVEVPDLRVLILGAGGGAGRAVAVQCALEKCPRLILVNRTPEKAESLVHELKASGSVTHVTAVPWDDESLRGVLRDADLVVNGTSLGMKPADPPLLPPASLEARHRVFDMVYRADGQMTHLGAAAREAGAAYIDGATLLLHQGAISFEHWFHMPAPLEAMRAGLRAALLS
ncbi:MAG: shikimate dehydrogenase [Verrucomicrobiaceae bacterium]|nr:shikimate dehydrogenase [Verrucomicrobiaceae bacterium]